LGLYEVPVVPSGFLWRLVLGLLCSSPHCVDKNIPHQQNLSGRGICLIVLDGHSTSIGDLVSLMPDVLTAVDVLQPGQFLRIGAQ
jgi:hypothetical protein